MPWPMIELLFIAVAVSVATNYVRRRLVTPEDMRKMAESQQFKRQLFEAKRKGDEKALQRLMKREAYYKKIDAEVGKKNLITMFATLGIFYAVWVLLGPIYGGYEAVAFLPGDLTIPLLSQGDRMSFIGWFILSLFAVGMPIAKVLGVGMAPQEVGKGAEKSVKDEKQET